jgi:hypothetical protein
VRARSAPPDITAKALWWSERMLGWLAGFGKLRIRFKRCLDIHLALLRLACAVITLALNE